MAEHVGLHEAAATGDVGAVTAAIRSGVQPHLQDEATGVSALMLAAGAGHIDAVRCLLDAGAPWNALDRTSACAGNYALKAGHQRVVDLLVDHAVRCELLLGRSARATAAAAEAAISSAANEAADAGESESYLGGSVRAVGERGGGDALLDAGGDAVMMEWERPIMEAHAALLCAAHGDVLNIGYGMGIVDGEIAARGVASHTIVEAHPQVFERALAAGWGDRPGVRLLMGRWQEVLPTLPPASLDAIYYDAYAEDDSDMQQLHSLLPRLLRPGGVYSFFNGMCPRNVFFQGVACQVVSLELEQLGFRTEFHPLELQRPPGDAEWEGVARRYYHSGTYYLPHAVFAAGAPEAAADRGQAGEADDRLPTGMPPIAEQFARLNMPAVHLLAGSIGCAPADSAAGSDGGSGGVVDMDAHPRYGAELTGLRTLLCEQVLPHFEEAGWRLRAAMRALWTEADSGLDSAALSQLAERLAAALDANSAAIVAYIAQISTSGAVDLPPELQLAVLPNPLNASASAAGAASPAATVQDTGGEAYVSAAPTAGDADPRGGTDCAQRKYDSESAFWGAVGVDGEGGARDVSASRPGRSSEWYDKSKRHWDAAAPTCAGMLGGLEQVHAVDTQGSLELLDMLCGQGLPRDLALDVGAGIGRVSASVLLERFDQVELLERSAALLAEARVRLPVHRVRAVHEVSLHEFSPPAGKVYSAVWVQWVLPYLTDDDLAVFLRRCSAAMHEHGYMIVKESVASAASGFFADLSDSSMTRTDKHFRRLFEAAGLELVHTSVQAGMPAGVFSVRMYVLRLPRAPQAPSK